MAKNQYKLVTCTINGREVEKMVDVRASLTDMLRNDFSLTSVKKGCEVGECGACNVLIDGECFNSCLYLAVWAEGKNITTLEGLTGPNGELSDIQQALIDEQMDMEVRGHEIDSFYQSHTDLYRLEYPLAKGVYIKIPLKGKDVKKVQQWYKKSDQETLENLEKYSLQNAVDYLYFYDQWIKIEDIVKKLPVHVTDVSAYIKKFPDVEVKDTAFHYFLHVDSLLGVGELEPIEYATPKIREALLNIRRMELMKRLRYQLYEEAQADEAVTYYY